MSALNLQTAETVEAIVSQLMEKQRLARNGAANGVPTAPLSVTSAASMLNNTNGNNANASAVNSVNHPQQPVIIHSNSILADLIRLFNLIRFD